MECPICFKPIQDSVVTNCIHHFCKKCLNEWGRKKDNCPKCRSFLYSIKNDEEFNYINKELYNLNNDILEKDINTPILPYSESKYSDLQNISLYTLSLSKLPSKSIGMSVTGDQYNFVKISKVEPKGLAHLVGLKKGDTIISINNIPSISHEQTIKLIELYKHINSDISLEIIPVEKPSSYRFCGSLQNLF